MNANQADCIPPEFLMKRRILLVDDEPVILLTLKTIFEIHGFEIETATSAKQGVSQLSTNVYHLVITDMRMEHDKAGYDVIQAAKKMAYDPAIAIMTAYPLPMSEWQPEGAECMLIKPMNAADLVRQIEILLVQHEDQKGQRILVREGANGSSQNQTAKKSA